MYNMNRFAIPCHPRLLPLLILLHLDFGISLCLQTNGGYKSREKPGTAAMAVRHTITTLEDGGRPCYKSSHLIVALCFYIHNKHNRQISTFYSTHLHMLPLEMWWTQVAASQCHSCYIIMERCQSERLFRPKTTASAVSSCESATASLIPVLYRQLATAWQLQSLFGAGF